MITFDDSCEQTASTCFMTTPKKKLLAVVSDLMFTVQIQETAKRAGFDVVFVKSQPDALRLVKEKPDLMIIDLNDAGSEPLRLIAELKGSEETRGIPLMGYVPHVQVALRQAAQDAGCDVVVARSAFMQTLWQRLCGTV